MPTSTAKVRAFCKACKRKFRLPVLDESRDYACPGCGGPLKFRSLRLSRGAAPAALERTQPIDTLKATAEAAAKKRLGKYLLERELGRGGMGIVYLAQDTELRRAVALKVLRHDDSQERTRFFREARVVSALRHPNIVALHDFGEDGGHAFFTMDYIQGRSLDAMIRGQQLPGRKAAELVRTIARALEYAHGRGMIHRDVKPSNILVGDDGTPFLMDFGLARPVREGSTQLTITGALLGTPGYMSPEQATSGTLDGRTDVWSLGVVLYEALTGRLPFGGEDILDVLQSILRDAPRPPREARPGVERDLEVICLKALEKDRSRRYDSAREMADDLDRFLAGEPVRAKLPGPVVKAVRFAKRRPALTTGLVAAVALVATAAALGSRKPVVTTRVVEKPAAPATKVEEARDAGAPERDWSDVAARARRKLQGGDYAGALLELKSFRPTAGQRPDYDALVNEANRRAKAAFEALQREALDALAKGDLAKAREAYRRIERLEIPEFTALTRDGLDDVERRMGADREKEEQLGDLARLRREVATDCAARDHAKARGRIDAARGALTRCGAELEGAAKVVAWSEGFWGALAAGAKKKAATGAAAEIENFGPAPLAGGTEAKLRIRNVVSGKDLEADWERLPVGDRIALARDGGASGESVGAWLALRGNSGGAREAWRNAAGRPQLEEFFSSVEIRPARIAAPKDVPFVAPRHDAEFAVLPVSTDGRRRWTWSFSSAAQLADWRLAESVDGAAGMGAWVADGALWLRNASLEFPAPLDGDVAFAATFIGQAGAQGKTALEFRGCRWLFEPAGRSRFFAPDGSELARFEHSPAGSGIRTRLSLAHARGVVTLRRDGEVLRTVRVPDLPPGTCGLRAFDGALLLCEEAAVVAPNPAEWRARFAAARAFLADPAAADARAFATPESIPGKTGRWEATSSGIRGAGTLALPAGSASRIRFQYALLLPGAVSVSAGPKVGLPSELVRVWRSVEVVVCGEHLWVTVDGRIRMRTEGLERTGEEVTLAFRGRALVRGITAEPLRGKPRWPKPGESLKAPGEDPPDEGEEIDEIPPSEGEPPPSEPEPPPDPGPEEPEPVPDPLPPPPDPDPTPEPEPLPEPEPAPDPAPPEEPPMEEPPAEEPPPEEPPIEEPPTEEPPVEDPPEEPSAPEEPGMEEPPPEEPPGPS